jgi:hypothetical protein
MLPLTLPLHHGEPGDPVLLGWIKHRLDELLGLEPGAVVVLLGLLILAIPATILVLYVVQRGRASSK